MKMLPYLILPIITLIYLIINLILLKYNIIICESDGCSLTKTILKVDVSVLYYLGISVYLTLLFLYFIKHKILFKLVILCIFVLESYMLFKFNQLTGEYCILCIGFYSLICLNLFVIFYTSIKNFIINTKLMIYFILFLLGMNIGLYILNNYILLKENNNIINIQPLTKKYTVLGTNECKFCQKLKEKLITNNIDFESVDYYNYESTLKLLNFTQIPVLIIKKDNNMYEFVNGEKNINKKLEQKDVVDNIKEKSEVESIDNLYNSLLGISSSNQSEQEDGCTILSTEKCD